MILQKTPKIQKKQTSKKILKESIIQFTFSLPHALFFFFLTESESLKNPYSAFFYNFLYEESNNNHAYCPSFHQIF